LQSLHGLAKAERPRTLIVMNENLPWVILVALLVWIGAPLLHRAFLRWRGRQREVAKNQAEEDARAEREKAEAQAAAQQLEADQAALEQARQQAAAQQEAEQIEAARREVERLEALQAERARQAAAEAAAQAAAEQEAQRAEAARVLAQQAEQARQAEAAAAAEKARRDEAERLEAELACEQARRDAQEAARLQAQAEALARATPRTPAQTLVLVADDSKVVRVKTSRLLIKHGYRVSLAEDGSDAARQLAHTPPHVLITDVEMPGMDGFELSRHVRALPHMAHVPIIMITAAGEKYAPQAAQVGVNVLLGKPYRDDELIAHVESSLTFSPEHDAKLALR
jgi:CheY-like chemotaxis protein